MWSAKPATTRSTPGNAAPLTHQSLESPVLGNGYAGFGGGSLEKVLPGRNLAMRPTLRPNRPVGVKNVVGNRHPGSRVYKTDLATGGGPCSPWCSRRCGRDAPRR